MSRPSCSDRGHWHALAVFHFLLLALLTVRVSAATLTVNGSQTFQTIDGYGVNVNAGWWNNGEVKPALDMLVDQLGATIFRSVIEEMDWEAVNDNSDPNIFDWTYYNSVYSNARFQGVWNTLRYLNQKGIVSGLVISFMGQPPSWMGPNSTVSPANEDEFVETMASLLYYARKTAGISFTLVSPINEADTGGVEGPNMGAAQMAVVLHKLAVKVDAIGMSDVRFVAPEAAGDWTSFFNACVADPVIMAKLAYWGVHKYGDTTGDSQITISGSAYPNKPLWVTETASFSNMLGQIPGNPTSNLVWDGFDSIYQHAIRAGRGNTPPNDSPGIELPLIAYNSTTHLYTPRKGFYEHAQLFKFVAKGAVRIGTTDNDANLTTYAFRHPATGRLTIVGRNTNGSAMTVNGTLTNLPAAVSTLEFYRTNSTLDLARGTDIAVASGNFSVSIPGNTYFTLATPVPKLDTHEVVVDGTGKLLSWFAPQDRAYAQVAKLSADFIKAAMVGPIDGANGKPVIYTHSEYDPDTFFGSGWPNHPAGRNSMLADSMILYYQYSGDAGVLNAIKSLLDYQLTSAGTTPANYNWANVPWSASAASNLQYGTDSIAEGVGMIEPDKIGELGINGYLRFYQITGDTRYRDAAIACADALASHVRTGTATQSPWPFRVNAQTNALASTPEDYCAHVIAPIRLFDELIRLNLGNVAAYTTARATAWNWLMTYPMTNNIWTKYFEDVGPDASHSSNINQYNPGQTARYLLEHPELDPNWQTHVEGIIAWIETNFGGTDQGEAGLQYGARTISEQNAYKFKMCSHTGRFAAVNALYAERTGNAVAKDKAFRSLNWCSYMARNTGSVIEGPAEYAQNRNNWFSDGHGDYIRHFMLAMGAFPEWAPSSENHLLRSSSVVKTVAYNPGSIAYTTFDGASTEVFRLSSTPLSVTANGTTLTQRADLNQQGWTYDAASGVLRVRHDAATSMVVNHSAVNVWPTCALTSPTANATVGPPASITLIATATDSDGTIAKVEFFNGATKLGEDTTAPYHFAWNNVPAGNYTLTAVATDNQGAQTTSASVAFSVGIPSNVAFGESVAGDTTDTLTDNTGAYINACRFPATRTMTINSIYAIVGAISGSYQCAVYEDFNGSPRNLLAKSSTLTNVAAGLRDFPLVSPPTAALNVTAGTYYWLAIWSNDAAARISAVNSGTIRFAAYLFGTWPPTVNLPGSGTFTYTIYATGTAASNAAPTCNAGGNQTISLPASASLAGTASDDGQPGTLGTTWVVESGPGAVALGNANALTTTATFILPGSYVLRLLASDGAVSTASDVLITVRDSFAAWAVRNGVTATTDDGDRDGLSELQEYAFRTNPAANTAPPWSFTLNGGRLRLTFPRDPSLNDVTYTVRASNDLSGWTPIARSTGGALTLNLGAFTVTESPNGSLLNVTVTDSAVESPRFLQLEVSAP